MLRVLEQAIVFVGFNEGAERRDGGGRVLLLHPRFQRGRDFLDDFLVQSSDGGSRSLALLGSGDFGHVMLDRPLDARVEAFRNGRFQLGRIFLLEEAHNRLVIGPVQEGIRTGHLSKVRQGFVPLD